MELFERLATVADRARELEGQLQTEEATKNALILPFLRALGYDPFDPHEVNPEFTADVGIKRNEKVDYAICLEGEPVILVECKCQGTNLARYSSQLFRYFSVTPARVAILTDGLTYRFYSDLVLPNKLDETPFLDVRLENVTAEEAEQLAWFSKALFNIDSILSVAEDLRYSKAIRDHFGNLIAEPTDDFLKMLIEPVYQGRFRSSVLEQYRPIVVRAINQHLASLVERRLNRALGSGANTTSAAEPDPSSQIQEDEGEVTTMEEIQGFCTVKAILAGQISPSRIAARDVQSYFGILLDDNNRKPICRLWFNRSQKYLGVFDNDKKETRVPIESVDDLFNHADQIRESLAHALS